MLTAGREQWQSPVMSSSLGSVCHLLLCLQVSVCVTGILCEEEYYSVCAVCRLRCLQSLEMLLMGSNLLTERRPPCLSPLVSLTL